MTYYSYERRDIAKHIPKNCINLLDIGCGEGHFGRFLKEQIPDITVHGIEPVKAAAEVASQHLDHVYHAPFNDKIDLPQNYFDVITFNDSLEHFIEPYTPLELAKKLLKSDAILIASIPNFRYIENIEHILLEKDFRYTDEGILDKTHLRFFTLKSIRRLFNDANFEVIRIEGLNPHYWSGKKIMLLKLLFKCWIDDMRYLQYLVIAKPR